MLVLLFLTAIVVTKELPAAILVLQMRTSSAVTQASQETARKDDSNTRLLVLLCLSQINTDSHLVDIITI